MLLYLLSSDELIGLLARQHRFAPWIYYLARTSDGSTHQALVAHAWVLARANRANAMGTRVLRSDVADQGSCGKNSPGGHGWQRIEPLQRCYSSWNCATTGQCWAHVARKHLDHEFPFVYRRHQLSLRIQWPKRR